MKNKESHIEQDYEEQTRSLGKRGWGRLRRWVESFKEVYENEEKEEEREKGKNNAEIENIPRNDMKEMKKAPREEQIYSSKNNKASSENADSWNVKGI